VDLRATRLRQRAHHAHGALCVDHPGVRVEHDRVVPERHAGPPFGGRRRRHQLHGHAERAQDLVHLLLLAGRAEVEPARGLHQFLARLIG